MIVITLARKPPVGTIASNATLWGTGGLNIDKSRIPVGSEEVVKIPWAPCHHPSDFARIISHGAYSAEENAAGFERMRDMGRFPANVILSQTAAKRMDDQSGFSQSPPVGSIVTLKAFTIFYDAKKIGKNTYEMHHGDAGGASRFFKIIRE